MKAKIKMGNTSVVNNIIFEENKMWENASKTRQ